MKKLILCIALLPLLLTAFGQVRDGITVTGAVVERSGESVEVSMMIDVSSLRLRGSSTAVLTPSLRGMERSVELPSVEIMGGRQYIWHLRNKKYGSSEVHRRNADARQFIPYRTTLRYEPWMDAALLYITDSRRKCCTHVVSGAEVSTGLGLLPEIMAGTPVPEFVPRPAYMRPEVSSKAGAKVRSIGGSAFVNFPVNRWEVLEDYMDNASELAKIRSTVQAARSSEDYTITGISLTGFASPEGSWTHNAELALNRTLAMKDYLCRREAIDPELIRTSFVAEDWKGLRSFVADSYLPRREEMLGVIDGSLAPDTKEERLKKDFPSQYNVLKERCFPLLRHTDYTIEYEVRSYADLAQIRRVFATRPGDLSIEELHALAADCETGSEEFIRVCECAAGLYPDDAACNLNAAVAALLAGNTDRAKDCLYHAGNSPEAVNARAMLAYYTGDSATALRLFAEAASRGLTEAVQNEISLKQYLKSKSE